MIKIPTTGNKYSQANTSDLFGNIHYSKNMNFDEDGYAKLSSRCVSIIDSRTNTDFNTPVSYGRHGSSNFFIATIEEPFVSTINEQTISVVLDSGLSAPPLDPETRGTWWQNLWHVTSDTAMFYKDPVLGNWNNSGITLTSNVVHKPEVFRNRNQLVVSNGNILNQFDINYSSTIDLVLPSDYEIIGVSYSNNNVGIITKLSASASAQNQEAYFFVWDGTDTSVNQGFPVGSDVIMAIAPYKSSWIILTRAGDIKYFNSGGFENLVSLPFSHLGINWGSSDNIEMLGDVIVADGEVIYININTALNRFGKQNEVYLPQYPGGVLCYDPKVGLYHRYSPSISSIMMVSVDQDNVNTTTDIFTTTDPLYDTGSQILYTSNYTNLIGGLYTANVYYLIKLTATTFKLALTKQDALDLNAINITSQGDSVNFFVNLNTIDYGASFTQGRSGGIALMGVNNNVFDHLMFGGEYLTYDTNIEYEYLNITVPFFKNIGYFVTAKISSANIEDIVQKVFIKYRPLSSGDEIILKYITESIPGFPLTTPQSGISCIWTSSTTFTTTANLNAIVQYLTLDTFNECEVEITSGAGAGQLSQISSIILVGSTYTVTLKDTIDGAVSEYTFNVVIDTWKLLGSINYSDTKGWKEFPITRPSKWFKLKVELRGVETTIEELQIINKTQVPGV